MTVLLEERTEAQTAAGRGAAFLDEHRTDHWRTKIDRDRLDIGDECNCVLGQLYGDYNVGLRELGLCGDSYRRWRTRELGFNGRVDEFEEMTEAWRELL